MFSLSLLLIGCNPQDVSLTDADFHAWLANKSSSTVAEARLTCSDGVDNNNDGNVDEDDAQCQGNTMPSATETKCDDGNDNDGDGLVDGDDNDCSTGIAEVPYLNPATVTTINCASGEELAGVCADDVNSAEYISWIKDDVYFLNQGAIEPWRSEGIITSEGDLQVTVHHDLGAGADFRFAFVVDPNFRPSVCIQEGQSCYTGEDGDGDGWVDHEDPDCLYGSWEGGFTASICNDGFDNDGDGTVDRDDVDCEHPFDTSEASTDPSCEDGDDNDGDGWIDSADPDCAVIGAAESGFGGATECNDNIDNDGDSFVDMDDDSCANALDNGEGGPNNKRICRDDYDNDGDGWIDDDDPECTIYGEEAGVGFAACNDGVDNDLDGFVDIDDAGCTTGYDGSEGDTDGTCADGDDNDGDGWVDFDDPDCLLGDAEDDSFFGIAACNDGIDNPDEDGTLDEDVDADDSDCKSGWDNAEERIASGSCTDGEDNDGDGWIDSADSECLYGGVENYFGVTACNDGMDNDFDGFADAEDADCLFGTQMTEASFGADCADGVDNDGDSWIDSEDAGCMSGGDEISNVGTECADGIDNDLDGFADAEDADCFTGMDTMELTDDSCGDDIDNDLDGWVDSDDTDCQSSSIAYERGLGTGACEDGVDNDGDTLIDGEDAGCSNSQDANEEEFDQCSDGVDNDVDGWVDALDPDCSGGSVYEDGVIAVSQCNDGADNDSDGLSDFEDPECVSAWDNIEEIQVAGAPIPMDLDYAPVVEQWSADEDGHQIFYINAGSYQLNPYDDEEYWVLPQEWLSGYAIAKYGAEEFDVLPNDFTYIGVDAQSPNPDAYAAAITSIEEMAGVWASEYENYAYMASDNNDSPLFELKVEGNEWRPLDLSHAGLDNWAEIHHSWVRVADGATYEVGSSVSGDFQIYLAGFESGSNLVVRGSFEIPVLGDDPWAYGDLEAELRERNNTVTCEF
jgi:hypothetical protein